MIFMLLLTHIIIAISGLVVTGLAYFRPSKAKLNIGFSLIALTILSGTILVLRLHTSLTAACLSGLAYLAVSLTGLSFARQKLAAEKQSDR